MAQDFKSLPLFSFFENYLFNNKIFYDPETKKTKLFFRSYFLMEVDVFPCSLLSVNFFFFFLK